MPDTLQSTGLRISSEAVRTLDNNAKRLGVSRAALVDVLALNWSHLVALDELAPLLPPKPNGTAGKPRRRTSKRG